MQFQPGHPVPKVVWPLVRPAVRHQAGLLGVLWQRVQLVPAVALRAAQPVPRAVQPELAPGAVLIARAEHQPGALQEPHGYGAAE